MKSFPLTLPNPHNLPVSANASAGETHADAAAKAYLFFDLSAAPYAIEARRVREIVQRPALSPLVRAPKAIVGAVDWRGRVAPIVDLDARLGHAPRGVDGDDHIIFVEHEAHLFGLLVGAVHEVRAVASDAVEAPALGWTGAAHGGVVGVTRVAGHLVSLIDLEALLPLGETFGEEIQAAAVANDFSSTNACGEIWDENHPVLQARAQALRQPTAHGAADEESLALAVVSLGGELWGVDLGVVREFCPLGPFAPVPCCPPHIVGQINLRGDVLTLVDIRAALELPSSIPFGARQTTLVVQAEEFRVGVPVDEVLDVRLLGIDEVFALPAAAAARSQWVRATAAWNGSILSVLDLNALLMGDELWVDEEV